MNRRGVDFFNNFISILVAVAVIALFAVAWSKFSSLSNTNNDVESVKTLVEEISSEVDRISEGQKTEMVIRGVNGWYLFSYDSDDPSDSRPDKCFFENCICIASTPTKEGCQENGIHRSLDFETIEVFQVRSYREDPRADCIGGNDNPADVSRMSYLDLEGFPADYQDSDYIILDSNLIDLQISKINDSLVIAYADKVIEKDYLAGCAGVGGGV